jgi:hypothetical protein
MMVIYLDIGTLAVNRSGRAALRREQWEWSENENSEKRRE